LGQHGGGPALGGRGHAPAALSRLSPSANGKSFLVLFFKKELLSFG
jgi:hypothetical protein